MPLSSQVISGLSAGAVLVFLAASEPHENASNCACSAGVTQARSLPFVGLVDGVDWRPGAGLGAGVVLPSAPTTSLVGPPATSTGRKSSLALDLMRSSVCWSGVPGMETTMFFEPSVRDLRLGDAGGVDALADDRHGLVELLLLDLLPALQLRRQDDLRSALEVERELGQPRRVAPDDARGEGAEEHDDDDAEPTQ